MMKHHGYPTQWEPQKKVKTSPQTLAEFLSNQFFLGFQDQISRWDSLAKTSGSTFPPYNLLKVDDDHYTVELALAGYSKDDIEVSVEKDLLTVKSVEKDDSKEATVLHQGIARRLWTQKFVLGEWMIVKEAILKDGLLTIKVERELPEEAKPKVIKVK
jgi:molecular chaperone IbpA